MSKIDEIKKQNEVYKLMGSVPKITESIDYLLSIIADASFKSKVLASHCAYCLESHTVIQPNHAFEKSQEIFEILCPEWRESEEKRLTQEMIDGKCYLIYGSNPKEENE